MVTYDLTKLNKAQAVRIMRVPGFQRANRSLLNARRGIKIRFSHLQMDHVDARALHAMRLFQHVHDNEWCDFLSTLGYHISACHFRLSFLNPQSSISIRSYDFIQRILDNPLGTVFE